MVLRAVWVELGKANDPLCLIHGHSFEAAFLDGSLVWQICGIGSLIVTFFLF